VRDTLQLIERTRAGVSGKKIKSLYVFTSLVTLTIEPEELEVARLVTPVAVRDISETVEFWRCFPIKRLASDAFLNGGVYVNSR
jgi:hypothetical protein